MCWVKSSVWKVCRPNLSRELTTGTLAICYQICTNFTHENWIYRIVPENRIPVKGKVCLRRDSNPWPLNLNSNALPNELKDIPITKSVEAAIYMYQSLTTSSSLRELVPEYLLSISVGDQRGFCHGFGPNVGANATEHRIHVKGECLPPSGFEPKTSKFKVRCSIKWAKRISDSPVSTSGNISTCVSMTLYCTLDKQNRKIKEYIILMTLSTYLNEFKVKILLCYALIFHRNISMSPRWTCTAWGCS